VWNQPFGWQVRFQNNPFKGQWRVPKSPTLLCCETLGLLLLQRKVLIKLKGTIGNIEKRSDSEKMFIAIKTLKELFG
jgi:hypothetical protein